MLTLIIVKNLTKLKNSNLFIFLFVILSAVFLRFYNYNFQDFWWDELMEFFTADPSLSLKETYLRAHSLTIRTDLDYDYATNANFYFYIYKFFLGFFSYTPGVARIITASFGLLVFLLSVIIYNRFIGKNLIFFSLLVSFNYYLVIQSQEFKYNIFFCFISLLSIFFFYLFINKKNVINNKTIKVFYFLSLLFTIWTNIFGFIIFFSQILTLFLKKRDILFKNIFYYFSLPILYFIINFKQLENFSKIKYFPVPNKQLDFFLDYDFKYFFGSVISGKIFLITFLILLFYNFRKVINSKFEITFLIILMFLSYCLPLVYSVKIIITFVLVSVSLSNTIYSLYILKKNDKPHITEVLTKIHQFENNSNIYVATSNSYLLNFLERKTEFKKLNINFIPCNKLNSLDLKTYWEIDMFPSGRFFRCKDVLINSGDEYKDSNIVQTIESRYARGFLISYK